MANRFLETNYFKSPFVKKLEGKLKSFYSFIICDCTPSGIWFLDLDAAKHYIGFDVSMSEFETNFVATKKAIKIAAGKYFFPDFIEHQYPGGLSDNNKAHKNILAELRKFNLLNINNSPKKEAPLEEPLEGIPKGTQGQGIGNGLGQGNEGETGNFLCPEMLKIYKKNMPLYGEDISRDYEPLLSIGKYIFTNRKFEGDFLTNHQKICYEWENVCLWIKSDTFYSQKSLKTISTHIQEIVNKSINGTFKKHPSGNSKSDGAFQLIDNLKRTYTGGR